MKSAKPDADLARWCEVLSSGTAEPETVPPGWFTIRQLADARRRAECTVAQSVKRMVEHGRAERKDFTVRCGSLVRAVAHYRLK